MSTRIRIVKISVISLFLIIAIVIILNKIYLSVEVTTTGNAQGFTIGESRSAAYEKANIMLSAGKISAIQVDPDYQNDSNWWLIVNPDWWNNKITLKFEENQLVEIRRDRICCELP